MTRGWLLYTLEVGRHKHFEKHSDAAVAAEAWLLK